MRIGFIGAGKVGFTLGKYFTVHNADVSGYYSKSETSAKAAAEFTHTRYYLSLNEIINDSDALFLTCPDGEIENVWNSIKRYSLTGKVICHCSGALSCAVFSEISQMGAFGYSIHPFFAISSKENSYKEISKAYITIEGDEKYLNYWETFFAKMGNSVKIISGEKKVLYHSAAVFASNLICALFEESIKLLKDCGFDEEQAREAVSPIFLNNAASLVKMGAVKALTGPVERNDAATVQKHLEVLSGDEKRIYRLLSGVLTDIAKIKNPDNNYDELRGLLK